MFSKLFPALFNTLVFNGVIPIKKELTRNPKYTEKNTRTETLPSLVLKPPGRKINLKHFKTL